MAFIYEIMIIIEINIAMIIDMWSTLNEDIAWHCQEFEENVRTTIDNFKHHQLKQLSEELVNFSGV